VATAAMTVATAAMTMSTTTATNKRYEGGRGIALKDRHGGCLCRPQYKTCGD
jgi:hypothetical protein